MPDYLPNKSSLIMVDNVIWWSFGNMFWMESFNCSKTFSFRHINLIPLWYKYCGHISYFLAWYELWSQLYKILCTLFPVHHLHMTHLFSDNILSMMLTIGIWYPVGNITILPGSHLLLRCLVIFYGNSLFTPSIIHSIL